ncbi:hypothetical protein SMACR_09168 [Sordaria macrospora]|uniref:WGS project CABT00000000 data, contig 2.74 n=2 Tax=Sordaria macrospora TaxID=5147 RepID=F7WBE6_SORMK|nr:uncharacterized protein SMAC_09168 [Sordaria macrospora k-hell]KAA8634001.1 hypothetical protein SMACR_09168 [Sordaria macrospora]WPJ66162.1 hypothetical protein SMAC4_09168 [Sordaria macrospora]CCC14957.1 unnamed protein product [Sordaria macrospora k-hell]
MSQQSHPTGTLANLPQPPSNPDTPSETPGTPTSTTTSLSTLSTTAIKDGHRGHVHHGSGPHTSNRFSGDYTRNPPSNPEAERNDRISRLPGMMSALRGVQSPGSAGTPQSAMNNLSYGQSLYYQQQQQSQQNNPNVPVTPAYFDAAGQPRAATKMSTVGSASATDSAYEGTTTASLSATSQAGTNTETAPDLDGGDDQSMTMNLDPRDNDTDMGMPTTSPPASGYATGPDTMMDDDEERLATRSVGTFDDRMSDYDDGRESLVGFGEGAGSTVSGPIYHRRPLPGQISGGPSGWGLERSSSGLSDMLAGGGGPPPTSSGSVGRGGVSGGGRDVIRDIIRREGGMLQDREYSGGSGGNDSMPASSQSATVSNERRDARMVDGVAFDGDHNSAATASLARFRSQFPPMDEDFVDTTATGPLPLPQNYSPTSAGRHQNREERPRSNQQQHNPYPFQQYQHHQQQQQQQHSRTYSEFQLRPMDASLPITPPTGEADPRETAERMLKDNVTGHDWKNV